MSEAAEIFHRLAAAEAGIIRLEPVAAKVDAHDRVIHGDGPKEPGLLVGFALLRETISEIRDGQRWLFRTVVGALILNVALVAVALFWRGATGAGLPDLKDELKSPPIVTAPRSL